MVGQRVRIAAGLGAIAAALGLGLPMPMGAAFEGGEINPNPMNPLNPQINPQINPSPPQPPQQGNQAERLLRDLTCPGCNLRGSSLVYANLMGADLRGADLRGANLSQATLVEADLRGADLRGATLHGADLQGAFLDGALLGGANLQDAILYGVTVAGAQVEQANLRGAVGVPTAWVSARDRFNWGVAEAERGNFAGAMAHYDAAIAQDGAFAEAYLNRAVARANLADYDGAAADSQRASTLFAQRNDPQGAQQASAFQTQLDDYLEASRERDRPRGGNGIGITILNFVRSVGSFLIPRLL
jgi:uncharacterized protein YjbI with pentapeptide repeats